jgi:TrpR-related protein YerC/YecD
MHQCIGATKIMVTFHLNDLPKEKRIQMIAELYDVINSLKNRNEVRLFFKDLLMPDEIATLMRRIEIAVLLSTGFNYRQISEILGVGQTKISNVQKVLQREGNGYKIITERLLNDRKKRLKIKKIKETDQSGFEILKAKYPGYFALNNLIDKVSETLDDDPAKKREAALFTPSLVSSKNKKHRASMH